MTCHNYQVDHSLIPSNRHVPSPDDLLQMSKKEISDVLCLFVLEVKNANGNDYTRDTLYDLLIMVQSFFKQNKCSYKFLEDTDFFDLRNTLDNRMKSLSKEGKISPREKAVPISHSEEEQMWNMGLLGDDMPVKLVDTLLYLLGVHFALRAAEEHKNLKVNSQLKVVYDESVGLKYLFYEEHTSKCNQGDLTNRLSVPKTGRAYENVVNKDRCVVRLFEKYMHHRPDHNPLCSKDFYLRPLSIPNGSVWYSCQPRGRHTLNKVLKNLCQKAGFSGKRTNHSCRAALATRLYEEGIDEQLICEKTGHRSVAVRSYKRTSSRQLKQVSDILCGNVEECKAKVPKTEPTCTVSKPPDTEVTDNKDKVHVSVNGQQNNNQAIDVTKGLVLNINVNVNK